MGREGPLVQPRRLLCKKSIQNSTLLFLFQLCDNFKGLEKSNKMVLMMHSGERVLPENKFLRGQETLVPATPGLLSSGFLHFYCFEGQETVLKCIQGFIHILHRNELFSLGYCK